MIIKQQKNNKIKAFLFGGDMDDRKKAHLHPCYPLAGPTDASGIMIVIKYKNANTTNDYNSKTL